MTSRSWWAARLQPYAEIYFAFLQYAENQISVLTDDELAALIDATTLPNQTNCWWATYAVAPIVRATAEQERERRRRVADS